jgi:hypothetical protein
MAPMSSATPNQSSAKLIDRAEYRFGAVLILLLGTFVLAMTGATSRWARLATVALTGATLLMALFAADAPARLRRLALIIVVFALVAAVPILFVGTPNGEGAAAVLEAALVFVAPIAIARSVLRRAVIDIQTVLAALCIYVLLGLLWAYVYNIVGAFGSAPFFSQGIDATTADYLYFSFVTQLTVGYGDLTAAGNLGRALAVLEGLIGQIYLVTVVAVLVSRLQPRSRREATPVERQEPSPPPES